MEGIIDRVSRILNKHNIRTIFKPKKTGQIVRNPKDQKPSLSFAGYTKYLIPDKYTLEKSGEWLIWIKEHQRNVRLKRVTQSTLSEHNIETGHQILFDKTTQ